MGELWDPAFDVFSGGIVAGGLGPWVLNAEVGCCVCAGAGGPLPAAVVCGDLAVCEVLHEVGLAELPVDVEVFGEEHGGDHADAVVHESGFEELAHACVYDGEAGGALFPFFKVLAGFFPG